MKHSWLAVAVILVLPLAAAAQQQSCDLGQSRVLYSVANNEIIYVGGPVFICESGARITADSAVVVQATSRADFMGHVRFEEPERSLTSMYAQYVSRERKLMAQQDVLLIDKKDGSTLRALSLDYFQKSATNPEGRIEVYSGRPHATLYRQRSNQPGVRDTTIVDSDRMQIVGENVFKGWGAVDVRRGRLTSKSNYAEFDQNGSYMKVYGRATVKSDTFNLSADSIDAELVNGDEFRTLHARRDAKLTSENVNIDAPVLHVSFADGNVERLVAVGGGRIHTTAPQAKATSRDFTLIADSIDALTPKQKLERVIAVGKAFGERQADTADAKLPSVIARDWVRGDTVTAYFGDARDTANQAPKRATPARNAQSQGDTTRVLERIVAKGAPATSTYRLRETVNDTTELSVNYITARYLDVKLRNGEVDKVIAEGQIRGLYLQPPRRVNARREGTQ